MWSGGWGGVGGEGGEEDRWRGHARQRAQQLQRPGAAARLVSEEQQGRVFPGGSAAKNLRVLCRGWGFDPWSGTRAHLPQLKAPEVTTTSQQGEDK